MIRIVRVSHHPGHRVSPPAPAGSAAPKVAAPVAAPPVPVPPDLWPVWAKALGVLRAGKDRGVGDTVARVVGPFGGQAFKAWYYMTFKESCGCADRQALWNRKYPYSGTAE